MSVIVLTWIPLFLKGKKFKGRIVFSENGERLLECVIVEIPDEKSEIKMM